MFGKSPSKGPETGDAWNEQMNQFDETFDTVVVGSGGGSMCAALVAREAGKSVVILEKSALIGGTTARSGGVMWIPNNPFMARDGVPDSLEQAAAYLDAVIGDHNPRHIPPGCAAS
jgi:3-oxosteroid 1-dehydrogenase